MSYASLLTTDAELGELASTGVDEYGNPLEEYAWTPTRCHLARATASEGNENVSADQVTAYLPAELDPPASAVLRVDGELWEFAGTPNRPRNPRTQARVTQVALRRASSS